MFALQKKGEMVCQCSKNVGKVLRVQIMHFFHGFYLSIGFFVSLVIFVFDFLLSIFFALQRGDERAVCVRFLRKFRSEFARSNVRDPQAVPFICSIVAIDEMRGTLYVEAQDDRVLKSCLRGVGGVSTMRMRLVPLDERTVAMDVGSDLSDAKNSKGKAKTEIEFKAGQFVRYRRGIYKGDLAQVIRFDTEKLFVAFVSRNVSLNILHFVPFPFYAEMKRG